MPLKRYRTPPCEEMATLTVRIPCRVKEALEHSAQRNRRSLTADLIVLIEEHAAHADLQQHADPFGDSTR